MKKKSILFIVKNRSEASSRFRVFAYYKQFEKDFEISTFYAQLPFKVPRFLRSPLRKLRYISIAFKARNYDVVYMQRPMTADDSNSVFYEWLITLFNPNLIFDYDDALYVLNETKMRKLVSLAKTVVCGNDILASFAKKYNSNVHVVPTTIDTDRFQPLAHEHDSNTITIGWTGTSSNYQFFTPHMVKDIKRLLNDYHHINFLFICDIKPPKNINFKYNFIKWNAETEANDLKKIDIGLMPLIDSPWSRGKCGFKLIQYGAIGITSVASDVGVNCDVVLNNKSGFLVHGEDWYEPLEKLIENTDLRRAYGIKAREHISMYYSQYANYPKLKSIIIETIKSSDKL